MKLLFKLFIKDYRNTDKCSVKTSYGVFASTVGIILNLIFFIIKLTIGIFINSISVITDAFNSLSDASSSIVGFLGIKFRDKSADKKHPFGYGRIEYIAAFIVSVIVIQVGLTLLRASIGKLISPDILEFNLISVIILSISVIIKLWLYYFYNRVAKIINSPVIKLSAKDSLNDVFITSGTIISILISHYFNLNLDAFIGIILSLFIMFSGFNLAKSTLSPLLGAPICKELYMGIINKIEENSCIMGTHDLIIHNYGENFNIASIHVEVPNNYTLLEIHSVIDEIERQIFKEFNVSLVIHMDPIDMTNNEINILKYELSKIVKNINNDLSIHDVVIRENQNHTNIFFDLLVPIHLIDLNIQKIEKEIKELNEKYVPIITIDNVLVET